MDTVCDCPIWQDKIDDLFIPWQPVLITLQKLTIGLVFIFYIS